MSNDPSDYTGYGGVHHALEQDGRGGHWTWELTLFLVPLNLLIVMVQVLTVLLTPIGVLLAASGSLEPERYGPLFSRPGPIVGTGIVIWLAARFVRLGLTRAFGGGAVSRSTLYSVSEEVR
ncbi:hypothetical protein IHN32_01845 [Deinococcus sp. 14RED07]|uniref:hypothetical protein n=1 Tax=Deinococcus sp. 14RED07 TaxID=2745874 RepID=UPI001E3FEA3C|nr:hypothetical protein [Deinococcus sp. 14RED07]MCD0174696.1 hypothetical protein [Deinococcus sp. 14RED07]